MIDLLIAAALLQAPDRCHAVEPAGPAPDDCPAWRLIGRDPEFEMFVDPASVRRSGTAFDVATRLVFDTAQEDGMRSVVIITHFDCASRTWVMRYTAMYDAGGALIMGGEVTGSPATPEPVPQQGSLRTVFTEFCPAGGQT